eukprot:TRINITY_DN8086_c0_g1_i3.p1 TRINITY_DN8086_c0_g1~~TRINITY_DN8086_c0_g1_i3.p1  ORF type:complete len:367 (-),score=133.75 TRINITY_DN8086_c0_g1_i3:661-1761(-)
MSAEEEESQAPGWRERMSNWTASGAREGQEEAPESLDESDPDGKPGRWTRMKSWTKNKVEGIKSDKPADASPGPIRLQDFYDLQNALLMVRQENIEEVERTATCKRELQALKSKYRELFQALQSGESVSRRSSVDEGDMSTPGSARTTGSAQIEESPGSGSQSAEHLRKQLETSDWKQKELFSQLTEANELARAAQEEAKELRGKLSLVQEQVDGLSSQQADKAAHEQESQSVAQKLEAQVCELEEKLVEAMKEVAEARSNAELETNAREAAELECQTLEEALGEEMNELEIQCEEADVEKEEANKRAAGLELELAEEKRMRKSSEKKTAQALKDLKRQLQREKDTREGLEKALEKQSEHVMSSAR